MAEITAKLVKELREKSGAGVMDAKKALVEVEGDIEKAIELLREKGMAKACLLYTSYHGRENRYDRDQL